jgi:signal transduction histidine kinase
VSRKRRLRARLAVLYACLLLGSGLLLLVVADLPLTTFGRTQAHTAGGRSGPTRSFTNLPEVITYSAIALAVLAVISLVLGWLVADRALRPLRVITSAARAISASSLGERLSVTGAHEEFRELGDTLNGLFARLEAAFDSQRRFVANASHELRNPPRRHADRLAGGAGRSRRQRAVAAGRLPAGAPARRTARTPR